MQQLVVTVDTEADWGATSGDFTRSRGELPYLLDTCLAAGIKPTFLLTYEMVMHDTVVDRLAGPARRHDCEIGHHLHVWTTPPLERPNASGVDEHWNGGIQSELTSEAFEAKMTTLHLAIEERFGVAPKSHRAGRWAIDLRTLRWLERHRYAVDTSVCPMINWTPTLGVKECIPTDTFVAPGLPYAPSRTDLVRPGIGGDAFDLLEVPVTPIPSTWASRLRFRGAGRLRRMLRAVGHAAPDPGSFRPTLPVSPREFESITRALFESPAVVLNLMLHSTELTLGASPSSRTREGLDAVRSRLEMVMRLAREYGITGSRLCDLAKPGQG